MLRTRRKNRVSSSSLLVSDPFSVRNSALRWTNIFHEGVHSFRGKKEPVPNKTKTAETSTDQR